MGARKTQPPRYLKSSKNFDFSNFIIFAGVSIYDSTSSLENVWLPYCTSPWLCCKHKVQAHIRWKSHHEYIKNYKIFSPSNQCTTLAIYQQQVYVPYIQHEKVELILRLHVIFCSHCQSDCLCAITCTFDLKRPSICGNKPLTPTSSTESDVLGWFLFSFSSILPRFMVRNGHQTVSKGNNYPGRCSSICCRMLSAIHKVHRYS